jgi:hypothetical protein
MCKHVYHPVKHLSNFYETWTEVTAMHTLASNALKISSEQFTIQTISSLTNLDHNSPQVPSMYIASHIPDFLTSDILHPSLFYFIIQS